MLGERDEGGAELEREREEDGTEVSSRSCVSNAFCVWTREGDAAWHARELSAVRELRREGFKTFDPR